MKWCHNFIIIVSIRTPVLFCLSCTFLSTSTVKNQIFCGEREGKNSTWPFHEEKKKTISLSDLMSGTLVKHIKILFIIIICGSLFSTSIFFNTTQEKIVTAKLSQLVLDIQKILSRVWTADQHQFTSSLFIKYWLSLAKCRENIFYTFIFADSTWFYFKNSQHLLIWLLLTFYEAHFELLNKPMQCNVMLVQSASSSSSKEVNNIQRLFKLTNCSSIYSWVLKPDAYVCVENEMKEEDMFNITQYS